MVPSPTQKNINHVDICNNNWCFKKTLGLFEQVFDIMFEQLKKYIKNNSSQQGPNNQFKLCNHNLCIGIIIFPHIDNTQSTGYN